MKLLWHVNVYSRVDHLRQQEHMILTHVPDVDIQVFCNKGDVNPKYREKYCDHTSVNKGHHGGVAQAFNSVMKYTGDYDYIIASHADVLLTDYDVVSAIIGEMVSSGKKLAQLCSVDGHNTHMNKTVPYVYCDLFIMKAQAWWELGEIDEKCDDERGIETTLGTRVREIMSASDILVIPARDMALNDPAFRFEDVYVEGVTCLRENDMGRKMAYLKQHHPRTYETLSALDASLAPR